MGCEYTSSNRHPSVYKHRHKSREWAAKKGCPLKNNAAWHQLPGHRVPAEGFQRIESKGKRSFFSYRYTGVQDMPRIQTVRAQQQELPVDESGMDKEGGVVEIQDFHMSDAGFNSSSDGVGDEEEEEEEEEEDDEDEEDEEEAEDEEDEEDEEVEVDEEEEEEEAAGGSLSEYEQRRLERMQQNQQLMQAAGLQAAVEELRGTATGPRGSAKRGDGSSRRRGGKGNERKHLHTHSRRLVRGRHGRHGLDLRESVAGAKHDGLYAHWCLYKVGDAVEVKPQSAKIWYPGVVTKVQQVPAGTRRPTESESGFSYEVRYDYKKLGRIEVINLDRIRICEDFNWCKNLNLKSLQIGDEVEARWEHMYGKEHMHSKEWYPGRVTGECKDGTYTITYDDNENGEPKDVEHKVRRENIRTKSDLAGLAASFAPCVEPRGLVQSAEMQSTEMSVAPDTSASGHWERTKGKRIWVEDCVGDSGTRGSGGDAERGGGGGGVSQWGGVLSNAPKLGYAFTTALYCCSLLLLFTPAL